MTNKATVINNFVKQYKIEVGILYNGWVYEQ